MYEYKYFCFSHKRYDKPNVQNFNIILILAFSKIAKSQKFNLNLH